MSGKICGNCVNWRIDSPLHLMGHCIINRMDIPHGRICDTCTKFESKWEYTRPLTKEELKGDES
jgi:hypothetical protein